MSEVVIPFLMVPSLTVSEVIIPFQMVPSPTVSEVIIPFQMVPSPTVSEVIILFPMVPSPAVSEGIPFQIIISSGSLPDHAKMVISTKIFSTSVVEVKVIQGSLTIPGEVVTIPGSFIIL